MLLNNNSLIMQWNRDENGNPMSWHIPLEVQQISPTHGVIQLAQVPDQHQRIKIVTEENIQLTEVFNIEDITLDSFYVDYGVGIVRFHESQHGKMVKVNYYGRGVILISDSRIFHRDGENVTDTWDNILDRSKDALNLIESAGGLVGAMEKIDEKIEQGNATADRLENFITETQFYGYTITLSREAFVVKAKESGEVGKTEISTIYTDVIVYKGAKQITPVLSIEQEYGCSFKVDGQRVKLTSMDINVIKANAVLNIDCGDGLVAQRKLEVTKVFDGVSQYSVEMTNPFYSFEANSEGYIEEEKTITCNISVTKANVDYTNYSISVQNAPRGLRYNIGTSSVDFTCTTGNSLPSSGSCLVVVTIDGTSFNKAFTWNKTRKGQDAKSLVLIGGQILRYETPDYSDIPTPHRSTVTAKTVGLSGTPKWYVRDNTTWNLLEGQVGTELTFMYNDTTIWGNRKETTIKCELEGYEDELTLVKLATGGNGTDAIAVILTNESHTVAIDNSGYVPESEMAKATTQVLAYQGIEVVTPILSKGACDGCDISIDGNTVRLHSLDNSFSTATAIINVNVNGVVVPKTWTISKAKQGTDGATGENGSSYILNVTDGTRSFTYSQINLDPRPSTSATFTGALYEDGTEIIEGVSYYWVARGHLQGSSVGKTFTPTIAKTFDESILNNDIQLTVTYKGNTVTQTIPISITKDANGLDWVQEWDDTKAEVRGNLILTPKIFAGSYDQDNDLITGVAVGKDVLNDGNTIGVAGYQNNKTTFLLDTDGTLMVGNPFEQDSTGLYFDGENFTLKVNELSIEGHSVPTTDDLTTQVDEAINSAKEEVKAEIEDVISQVNSLDSYMNNALKDGILDEVERNRLHTLYENITSEYLDTIAQYRSIAGNTHLTDEAMLAVLEGHFTTYLTCFEVLSDTFNTIMEAEVLTGEAVEAFKNAISDLRVASTDLLQSLTNALTCISESQANEIVTNAKLEIKQEIDDVSGALNSLETTMNGDFKSGLISTMNLTTLKSKLSQLETEKADIDGQYKGLIENSKLGATSRTNLSRAKGELDTAHDQLIIKINTAISDLLMTEAELTEINRLISVYGQKLKAYSEIAQQANADIALNLAQGAIQALNQEDIFNKLTNNGETQGIYLQNGKVYINGEYINSRNFKAVRNDGTETFKIDSEGNVHIRANSFHLVGDSIDTNLADKDYVDSAIESVATGSVNVMLSNEAQVIATSNSRVPFSNQTFSAKVGVYMGSTEVKDFTIGAISSANGISVSVNQSTKTINFSVSTEATITADNGSFTIPVSFNGNTYSKKWTWAVSKQGNTGATGEQGAGAKAADIVTSSQVFKSTDGGLTFSPTTITMTPKLQNVTYNGWQYSTNGGSTWSGLTNSISGWSVSNGVLTISKDSSLFTSTVTSVTFRLNTNDSSVYDTMTIVKLYDIADLEIGGRNYLQNSNFANGMDKWSIHDMSNSTGTNKSVSIVKGGSWADPNVNTLQIKGTNVTGRYGVQSSNITLVANTTYTISGYCAGHRVGKIQVNVRDKQNSDANIHTVEYNPVSGGNSLSKYYKFETTFTTTSNTLFALNLYTVNLADDGYAWFANVKLEKGNKASDWIPAPEDVDKNINDVKDSLNSFQNTVNTSFKDGVIEQAEAKAIAQHLKTLDGEKADIDKEYSTIYSNANLTGSTKTNLASAKTSFDSAHASLKSTINTVISDGKVTSSESASVTSTFNTYNTQLGVYKQRVQEALDNISSGKVDGVQVGGCNLYKNTKNVKQNDWGNGSGWSLVTLNNGFVAFSRGAAWNGLYQDISYETGETYTLSAYVKGSGGAKLNFYYNGGGSTQKTSFGSNDKYVVPETWTRVWATFKVVGSDFSKPRFENPTSGGTLQLYAIKMEKGNKPTDWTPAPEDLEDYADQSAQNAVNAQTQNSIFNKLTNNGQTQGIYLENSKIYINGEYIKANTLSADKVLVGDYTNYCQLTEQTPMSDKFNKYTHSDSTIWHEMKTLNRDTRVSRDYSCKGGEKFRVTGYVYGKVTSTTSGAGSTTQENTKFRVAIFGKKTDGSNFWIYGDSGDGASTGSIIQFNKVITLPSNAKSFYVALHIDGYAPFSGVARCRNIEVRRMNTGELIVDGSITAKSLHADVLSANSIVSTINGGSTNISGNKIRTGTIQSNNGKSTINLDNGSMNLGTTSDASYLQWTGSALNIKANSINIGSSSVATTTDVTNQINGIQIGSTNLVLNSDFSNGTSKWHAVSPWTIHSSLAYNNKKVIHLSRSGISADAWAELRSNNITAKAGETYTMSLDVKWSDIPSGQDCTIFIWGYKADGSNRKDIGAYTMTGSKDWTRIAITGTVPSGVEIIRACITHRRNGAVYATNFKMEKGNKATSWSPAPEDIETTVSVIEQRVTSAEQKITDTAITNTVKKNFYTKEETEDAITSKGYATQSQVQQTAESIQFKFTQTGGYNLIRNGNPKPWHEENWWVSGNGWWYRENSNDLGIQTSDTNEAYAGCATFKVQPGVNYSVSCWLMAETNTKGTDVYFIGSANDDGAYTEVHHLYSGSGNGNWVNVKATFTTGSNINYGFIRIDNNGRKDTSTTNNTVVFFSEVQMVKGSEYYPQWSPNPNEVYDGIVQMDKNGIKVSTSNGGWTDFTSVGMNVYNKSSALSLGTRNGGLTYHGGGAYLGFTSESIVEAYNTRGVSISTATDGAYISLGHSSATDPFGGFSSTPYLSIAKQDIGDSSSFYRRGVNVHTSLNLNTQNTNRAGTINFGTNNTSKIFESSANNLCMFGNDGVALGYYEGSSNVTKFKITEGSSSSTSYIDSYAHWRFNQWNLTDVGQLEVVSRLKMLGTSSLYFNANATHPSVMWHASGDGKLKIFGDNGVDIGYREGDTNRPIFKITEGEDGAYRLQSFSHWHFNNWNLDYVGNVHAQKFTIAGTSGSYYITKGTGDGADYTTYGCLFYTHNGLAFTANGGSVTVVVQGRSGRIMGKNAYYVNSSKCLKSDIRAVTSESEPMPVNLKQGEVVDETLTMEMIGDFIDTIGIRTYITDFEQEGATQRDVDPQQGHVLNLGYIADDLAHHPVFKYIGEKTPDNLYAINSNGLTTVALAGLQAERKERRKLEQRLQQLEAMLLKGEE